MPLPEKVLVDTSAFYALVSANDSFHRRAGEAFERLIDREQELWTTSYALVETMALIHRRLGFNTLSDFMARVEDTVGVFWVESSIHNEAWGRLTADQGVGMSFVDWTLATVSRILNAPIFTFDRGFAQQGLLTIPR